MSRFFIQALSWFYFVLFVAFQYPNFLISKWVAGKFDSVYGVLSFVVLFLISASLMGFLGSRLMIDSGKK